MKKVKSKKKSQKGGGSKGLLAKIEPYAYTPALIFLLIAVAITGGIVVANQDKLPLSPPRILLIFVIILVFSVYWTRGRITHPILPTVILAALIGGFIGHTAKKRFGDGLADAGEAQAGQYKHSVDPDVS